MEEPPASDEFAAFIGSLATAELIRTAAELNQQSLVLITHLMMIADEIARREALRAKKVGDC